MSGSTFRTIVYVDGFNLYFRALKGSPYRWLDLLAFSRHLLGPRYDVAVVRYFTARVVPSPGNPQVDLRQRTYLRALATIPEVDIHFGHFLKSQIRMPLAHPPIGGPNTVEVIRTEEKGSDVKLASHLLVDGYEAQYDVAVVVSNDSDLAPPIELVRTRLGRDVGVITPVRRGPKSRELQRVASWFRSVSTASLSQSQFPATFNDANGTVRKPPGW